MAIIQNEPRCRIQSGTYTGTGTYGSANPNKLTFAFKPKVVIVTINSGTDNEVSPLTMIGDTGLIGVHYGSTLYDISYSVSGKTISWWVNSTSGSSVYSQCNSNGVKYNWVAFG